MSSFSIDLKKTKGIVTEEEKLIQELSRLEIRIQSVKKGIRSNSSMSGIQNRISSVEEKISNEHSKLKKMKVVLNDANNMYEKTENNLLGAKIKEASSLEKFMKNIGTGLLLSGTAVCAPAYLMINGIRKGGKGIESWLQGKIDNTNNPYIDMFNFHAKDKSKFGSMSMNLASQWKDSNIDWQKNIAKKVNDINDSRKEVKKETYRDENGKSYDISKIIEKEKADPNSLSNEEKEALKKYKDVSSLSKEATIASIGTGISGAAWKIGDEGEKELLDINGVKVNANGSYEVAAFKAEANASAYAGLYSYTEDGQKRFTPGFGAEIGVGVTAFTASAAGAIGGEYFDVHGNAAVNVGKADAKASVNMGLFDKNGNLNPQLGANLSAEALAAEVTGTAGVKIAGTDLNVTGSLNVGIGAHANFGLNDGKLSVDVGATLGIGASIKFDVDFSGTVNAIADKASSAWATFTGWFN